MPPATHYLELEFRPGRRPAPGQRTGEATVMDVNRQAWTGSTTLLVHPADLYVGLRSERVLCRTRQAAEDRPDRHRPGRQPGRRPARWRCTAARLEWKYRDGSGRKRRSTRRHAPSARRQSRSPASSRPRSAAATDHRHGHRRAGPQEPEPVHPLGERRQDPPPGRSNRKRSP